MNGRFRLHNSFLDPPIMTHWQNRLQHSNNNNNNNGIPLSPISPQTNRTWNKSEKGEEEEDDDDDILNVLFQKGLTLHETSTTTFNETTPQRISYNHNNNNPPQQRQRQQPQLQQQKQQKRKNIFNTPFILKVSNIPFDLSEYEMLEWFRKGLGLKPIQVYILMDKQTVSGHSTPGKTLSDSFVHLNSHSDCVKSIAVLQRSYLKGRVVTLNLSSTQELMTTMFPSYACSGGSFKEEEEEGVTATYLTRTEISNLLLVAKNYKSHYSRKTADRVFEQMIYIMLLIPFHNDTTNVYKQPSNLHRDQLFELVKLSVEYLLLHLSKDYKHVSDSILERMLNCVLECEGFSVRQKEIILKLSGIDNYGVLVSSSSGSSGSSSGNVQTSAASDTTSSETKEKLRNRVKELEAELEYWKQKYFNRLSGDNGN